MYVQSSVGEDPYLEGTREDLERLAVVLYDFARSDDERREIELRQDCDPAPYERLLAGLVLTRAQSNRIFVNSDGYIHMHGSPQLFESIAANLPFDAERLPYHIHYDHVSFSDVLADGSMGMIFGVA